jgi:hypothetical protein
MPATIEFVNPESVAKPVLAILQSQGAAARDVVKVNCYLSERPQNYERRSAAG